MKNPKVSVLMTAYNSEKYIAEAIESILKQTFKDFEFIIINDGSKDKTVKIIKSFKDPRIVLIDNKKNQGLIAVLNQGLDICRGEYIARMDSDDVSFSERFAKQIEFMDKNLDVGVLGTMGYIWDMSDINKSYIYSKKQKMTFIDILGRHRPDHPTTMIRRAVIEKYKFRYDKNYKCCEDYELWSRMIHVTKIENLQEVLFKHRWHGDNVSITDAVCQNENDLKVRQNMLNFLTDDKNMQDEINDIIKKNRKEWIKVPFIKIRHKSKKTIFRLFGIFPIWVKRNYK